jgi:hypothetical protein
MKTLKSSIFIIGLTFLALVTNLHAHCDSLDGPVIKDAERALSTKNVTPILKWVAVKDEDQIRQVFEMTLGIRGQNEAVRTIADNYFFETLVRIHRASEGEGFTGLKPLGSVEPPIAATDHALKEGNIDPLADKIATTVHEVIKKRFNDAYEKKKVAEASVAQGRLYVESYVQLTHLVEQIHHLVSHGASHKHLQSAEH